MQKFSIIMPVFNEEASIDHCLDSILSDIPSDQPITIVDNGSTDGTRERVNKYVSRGCNIELFSCEEKGVAASLNVGLEHSRGRWCIRMDSDDLWIRGRYALLDKNISSKTPFNYICGSSAYSLDNNGQIAAPIEVRDRHLSDAEEQLFNSWRCHFVSPFIHPTVCFNRLYIASLGGYPRRFPHCEDFALWSIAQKHGAIFSNFSQRTIGYRVPVNEEPGYLKKRDLQLLSHDQVLYLTSKRYSTGITFSDICCMRMHLVTPELGNTVKPLTQESMRSIIRYVRAVGRVTLGQDLSRLGDSMERFKAIINDQISGMISRLDAAITD